jgi:hypothetical protein
VNFTLRSRLIGVLTAGILCTAGSIAAQTTPHGVFGQDIAGAGAKTRLDFTATVVEGYDSDVPQSLLSTIDPSALDSGGFSSIVNASGTYGKKGANVDLGANFASTVRYYGELGAKNAGHSGGLGAQVRLPGRTTWLINQSAAYTPAYLYGLFPTGAVIEPGSQGTTAPDYSVSDFNSYSYTTTTALRHSLTPRSSVAGTADFVYTDRQRESEQWRDVSAYSMRGEFARNVTRNTSLSASAQYRSGEFGYAGEGKSEEVRLDLGLSYIRPLSATRRAAFHFKIGSAAADIPQAVLSTQLIERQYLGVAEAGIDYQFARGWEARGDYKRGLQYIVDLPEPLFADSFGGSVSGFLSRRIDLEMSGGYSSGASLLNQNSLQFDTYTADVRVRYGLNRTVALYGEYLYYFYDFRDGPQFRAGFAPGLTRNGVRAGLTLWMPGLRK